MSTGGWIRNMNGSPWSTLSLCSSLLVILYLPHFAHSTFFGLFECCSRIRLLLLFFFFFFFFCFKMEGSSQVRGWNEEECEAMHMYYSAEVHAFQPYNPSFQHHNVGAKLVAAILQQRP
jgi:hypothetical protein